MKKQLVVGLIISNITLLAIIFISSSEPQMGPPVAPTGDKEGLPIKIEAVKVPESLNFAGEVVPTQIIDVKERVDRELLRNTYWHSNSLHLFKMASRKFPIIEKILVEEGIPVDFKYLAMAESGLDNVVSPAGATGVWQFMKGAGREYGLEISSEVDERYHLEKATRAAARYLKDAYKEFGSWTLAAASYNMGGPGLKKVIEQQKVGSYYDLHLNSETKKYVFRIIAFKEIFANPTKYGFHLEQDDLYKPLEYRTVSVDSAIINLADFALTQNTNYKTLKILNPWLRSGVLSNPKARDYELKLPI